MIIPFSIVENMAARRQYTKEEDQRILDFVRGRKTELVAINGGGWQNT